MPIKFSVDFSEAIREIERLARGPGADGSTFHLERVFLEGFTRTQERVHVITGHLKASGHPETSLDSDVWSGTVHYARHPGIFELARKNKPTLNHPEGEHGFYDPMYETGDQFKEAVLRFLQGSHA